jgi:aspartate racemase
MEEDFYTGRMRERHGLDVMVPDAADRELVHRVIYDELCRGVIDDGSRLRFFDIMDRLRKAGAEGIILGCTEIPLLVMAPDGAGPATPGGIFDAPLFDSTRIHAEAAVALALT